MLQISPITYNRKETGRVPFTLPEAFTIAGRFKKTVDELFNSKK